MSAEPHRTTPGRPGRWWRSLFGRLMHPAPTKLSRYLDGELSVEQRDAVARHVRECGPCRRLLQSLAQTIGGLGSLREPAASGRAERIVATLGRAPREDA